MNILKIIIKLFFKIRLNQIKKLKENPFKAQEKVFFNLIKKARNTEWGRKYNYNLISNISDFQKKVPISTYEEISPFIIRMMEGEKNILWPGLIPWFAKSSGTTNTRSKYIPVSNDSLRDCHFRAGRDEVIMYLENNPKTKIFEGKSLCVGGSYNQIKKDPNIYCGDISAIMMKNLPLWGEYLRTPSLNTALLSDYEKKIERLAEESAGENVTSIAGVPTWMTLLIKRVVEKKGVKNIFEVWPNLEVFFHGAVSFIPYQELFENLIPSTEMLYMEAYNASEGFFAIQDDLSKKGEMMLLPNHGVFYEFIPMSEYSKQNPKILTMKDVEVGENYALVISTNAGLWRYVIGDTVSFTNLFPHRIKITGRTKHFINTFGEEVIVDNTDNAISFACKETNALIREYTVAPVFMGEGKSGAHEWVIEFEKEPNSLEEFKKILDMNLRKINSDYDAKRYKNIALTFPIINVVPEGTFYEWMKVRKKLGGQNKVPRLSNSREYLEEILSVKINK